MSTLSLGFGYDSGDGIFVIWNGTFCTWDGNLEFRQVYVMSVMAKCGRQGEK